MSKNHLDLGKSSKMTSQWHGMTLRWTFLSIFRPKSKIPFDWTCTSAACVSWSRLQGPIARFTTVESRIMLRWPPCIPLNETEFFLYKLFQVLSAVFLLKNNPSPTGNHCLQTGNHKLEKSWSLSGIIYIGMSIDTVLLLDIMTSKSTFKANSIICPTLTFWVV